MAHRKTNLQTKITNALLVLGALGSLAYAGWGLIEHVRAFGLPEHQPEQVRVR